MGDGTLHLSGQIWFWDTAESSSRSAKIIWADRAGNTDPSYTDVLSTNPDMVASALNDGKFHFLVVQFGPAESNFSMLDDSTGISKSWFEVDEGDG